MIDLVAGVALAGIGIGLSVLVVQARDSGEERSLLAESLRTGLAVSLPVLLAAVLAGWRFPELLAGNELAPALLVLAAASGWVAVVPGMINNWWQGRQRRDLMLWLAVASAALPILAAALAPRQELLAWTAFCFAAPAIIAPGVLRRKTLRPPSPERRSHRRALLRYALPGIVIGLLSPGSMVAARSLVSGALSWEDAGLLQALWRLSDWVGSVAAGMLSVYFLPRLTASCGTPQFHAELKRVGLLTVGPAAIAFALLLIFQRPLLALLYDESFRLSDATVALFFAGSLVRIAAWVPLFALYAMKRTTAITVGEFLSLPLFALLLALFARSLDLETAGALWLVSYLVYAAFNLWAALRSPAKPAL